MFALSTEQKCKVQRFRSWSLTGLVIQIVFFRNVSGALQGRHEQKQVAFDIMLDPSFYNQNVEMRRPLSSKEIRKSRRVSKDSSNSDSSTCSPVEHILFLKTHKTGGSTITNILNRFGESRNISFALPFQENFYTFLWPTRFRMTYVAPLYGMTDYHILCNHARYNRRPMNWLFPKQRTKYISILREPTAQYESVFNFMHFANALGYGDEKDPLGTFLKFPLPFQEIKTRMKKKNLALHLVRNPMLFDLGLDFRYFQNITAVQEYFKFLEQEFDLIMIMEHFDESLVLLKRLLCWNMTDILYFKLNERQEKQKQKRLSEHVKQDIRSWNQADVMLYEHFNKTFWRKIKDQGPDLEAFRRENKALKNTCLRNGRFLDEAYTGVFVKGYAVRKDLSAKQKRYCEKMVRNEISYVKYFRRKRIQGIKRIEEPDEFLDDPKNNWEIGSDLEHEPGLSGYFDPATADQDQGYSVED